MPTVICAGCGHTNGPDARFCEECGSSLAPRCPSCGAEVSSTARFCSSCGSPVAAEPASTGALKVVSVVFSDLVGSTELQEKLEPESVRRVMARFYEAMRGVVERHGGAIQKFIGDAVVAVFGVPSVSEDDAVRAVRCAAAMTDSLEELTDELQQTWGVRLQIRTGVNTGELAISDEGIFVGDTMNTAARLEQAAGAGQVLLGETTWRLVRHEVEVEEIEPLAAKGKSTPLRAWRVVSTQPRGAAAAEAPLVGRASELERLRAALDQARAALGCRLVTVIGSPGLGKSRLAAEFARSLEGQATVLEGHCEQSGEGITFLPVADVLRAAASIADDDPPEQVVAKLTETVPDAPDRERIVARVAGLLGAGPPAAPEETFWGVRTVLESLARERPLVVVLDDVHWGQPMFLDLIEHLVEWVRDAAILLVALARPELRETRGALAAAGRRAAEVIELDPLGPDQSRELVGGLLGTVDVPDELLERILETTEGNPLFLGELLRMLVDEGSLERSGDVWVAAGGAEAVQVPPTIQALLTARIERLRADERSVVERAAVIGKQFYRGAVAELVAPPVRSEIDGHLETLRRKDMVEPEGTYWIDEPVYRFHHVLIRDAAYHLLLKEARAELHEKFADWLETKAGELVGEHEEVIAYHLEQAHEYRRQLGPLDERGDAVGSRAAARLASAGRRALAREDLAAAANLLQRALDRQAGVAEDEMLWHLGEALISAGDTAAAGPAVSRLSGPRGHVLGAQLAVLTGTGSLEETLDRVVAATSALAAAGDDAAEAKGHHVTAQVQAQLGRVADVETSLDRALLAARKADDRRRITAVLAAAPRAALWGPSPVVRASGRCLDVVRILRMTPGNRHVEAVALRCQAVLEAMRGRADAAREILDGGRATLEELGLTLELHELAMHAGIVELLAGQPQAAEELLRSARDGFAGLGLSVSAGQAAALLARALVEQGRDEEALTETEYAEQHAGGDLKTTITWLGARAEAIARRGQTDEALELARRATALAEPTDALADKADANMALARVLRDAGHAEEARRAAENARALYEQKDHAVGVQWASELAARHAPEAPRGTSGSAATIDDPELAEHWALFVKCWEGRDPEGLAALYAEDYVNLDHRELGWGERTGHEANLEWARSALDLSPDLRVCLDRVIARAPGVFAVVATWSGHSAETGGEGEIPMGRVTTIRDGKITRTEIFAPDAEISMRACFEDLRGRMLLGDRTPERFYERFVDCFGRRDREGFAQIWSADIAFVDHRQIAWEELHDLESMLKLADSAFQMSPDMRCVVDEVIACDERVLAIRSRYVGSGSDGGGVIEIPAGTVNVTEGGHIVRSEWFDYDDREGMLARYRELGGTLDVLGDRPPERLWAEQKKRFDAHDLDGLLQLYAEEWTFTDHRQLGYERFGRSGAAEMFRSAFATSPDVRIDADRVIACDDRVIALQGAYRGTSPAAAGGEGEIPFSAVTFIESGLIRSTDIFAPDDEIATMARWRELHGLGLLGDRPPERELARFIELWRLRNLDALKEHWPEDIVLVDHRLLAWEEVNGREQLLQLSESAWNVSPDIRLCIDEVIASDDRRLAVRCTYVGTGAEGGGMMELPIGFVNVVETDRLIRTEVFDPDDRGAMLARYKELGGQMRASVRVMEDVRRAQNGRDYERLAELLAEDFYAVDHRALGWPEARGRERGMADLRSVYDASPTVRLDYEEIVAAGENVVVTLNAWRGRGLKAGEHEVRAGAVHLIKDGRWAGVDFYDPDDHHAMIARYVELGGGLEALGDSALERLYAEFARRYAACDLDGMLALMTDDWIQVDHRKLGWGEQDKDQYARQLLSVWDGVTHARADIDEVLASDGERTLAAICTFRGSAIATGGGGPFEYQIGTIATSDGERWQRSEWFDPDDRDAMLARFAELVGRTSQRLMSEVQRALNARDYEGLAELVAEDWYFVDHRALGWEEAHGRDECVAVMRSMFDPSPDVRFDLDEQLAADDRLLVVHAAVRGRGRKAGEHEVVAGAVYLFEDGRWAGVDFYDPDDRPAMIARYAELGGGAANLGDRPPEAVSRKFVRAFGTRNLEVLAELVADGFVLADHRGLGWEELVGRDAWLSTMRSSFDTSPDNRAEIDEVLACDDRVLAALVSFKGTASSGGGGGSFEFSVGQVSVVEDGRLVRTDQYDHDDREAILARYRELGGTVSVPGGRPPERWFAEFGRRWDAHDLNGLMELYADGWTMTDHRPMALWEGVGGLEGQRQLMASVFSTAPDARFQVDEVLACDDRVIALIGSFYGSLDAGGGEGRVQVGGVSVVEAGQHVSMDVYEPDDHRAMIARYAQLGGGAALLGDSPPERFFKKWLPLSAANDAEKLSAMLSEDFVRIDHRSIGWEPLRGREANVALWMSAYESAEHIRQEVDEVLACDDRVIAWRFSWRGVAEGAAGEFATSVGQVCVIEDGLYLSCDQYDTDDREGMLARFAELSGTASVLGDRAPERWLAHWIDRYGRHDREGLLELWADSCVFVDHRAMAWEELEGRDALLAVTESTWEVVPDNRCEVDEVLACDERVIAVSCTFRGTAADGGGPTEIAFGWVQVIENGLCLRVEQFAHDDREAMLARFAALSGGASVLGDRAPERVMSEITRLGNARDYERVADLTSDDWYMIDHRALGWEDAHGREGCLALLRSAFDASPEVRLDVEVLASDERVLVSLNTWHGQGVKAGELEVRAGAVTLVEHGRWVGTDFYEPDDRTAMMARYVELGGGLGKLGDTASEKLFAEYARRYARRDYEGVLAMMSEDYVQVDHRTLGWTEIGKDQNAAEIRSVWAGTTDIRPEVEEVLAADDRVLACICTYRGSADATGGGGQFEYPVGFLLVTDGEVSTRVEWFNAEDRDPILARCRELSTGPRGDRPPERFFAEFCRRWTSGNVEDILDLYSEDYVNVDHRRLGWENIDSPRALREFVESALGAAADLRCEVDEVLDCDERVIALSTTWRGHSADTGGEVEFKFGYVAVVEDGLLVRQDHYDHDDTEGMLARYEELSAGPAAQTIIRRCELCNSRQQDELRALYAADYELIDHRPMPWEHVSGGEGLTALVDGMLEVSPDATVKLDVLDDDRGDVVAYRQTWSGTFGAAGLAEIVIDTVSMVRDGLIVRSELFEPGQQDEMRRRLAELRAERSLAPGVVVRDRRGLPRRDLRGIEAYRELVATESLGDPVQTNADLALFQRGDDPALLAVVRSQDGVIAEVVVTRAPQIAAAWMTALSMRPHAEVIDAFPGAFVVSTDTGFDAVRSDDGKTEHFSDRDAAVTRAEELAGLKPWMDMARNFVQAINSRDWDAFLSMYAHDYLLVDNRLMGWGELQGPEQMVEVLKGTIELAPDAALSLLELLDFDLDVGLGVARQTYTGQWDGGAYEIAWDSVMLVEDGRLIRGEVFGLDQVEAMRARVAELRASD